MLLSANYTPEEVYQITAKYLEEYTYNEEIWWILEKIFQSSKTKLLSQKSVLLQQSHISELEQIKIFLSESKPLAYILGFTEFANLKIKTREPILIPRPETEEWVLNLTNKLKNKAIKNILDIGTGSGCIALALKKALSNADVTAIDINPDAIKLAKENSQLNSLEVNFILSDLFENLPQQKFDLIVSNPPYISPIEYEQLDNSVKKYEDKNALTAGDNGLEIIKKIIKNSLNYLKENGLLVIEIDRNQDNILDWARQQGWKNCFSKKDFNNQTRVIFLSNAVYKI